MTTAAVNPHVLPKQGAWVKLHREIRGLFFLMVGAALLWLFPPRSCARRILLLRPERMGDFLVFTPLLRAVRREFPGHEISVVVSSEIASWACSSPEADGYVVRDRERRHEIRSRWRALWEIRRLAAGTVVYPSVHRETWVDEMAVWSGAPVRIGFAGNTFATRAWLLRLGSFLYTRLLRRETGSETGNMQRVLDLLKPGARTDTRPHVELPEPAKRKAEGTLKDLSLHPFGPGWVLIAPAARESIRLWRSDGFAEIARRLQERHRLRSVLVAAADEKEILDAIRGRAPELDIPALPGVLSLMEVAALARHAEVFVGVESGPIHLATAAGIPAVCVMAGGEFGRFFPYGDPKLNRVAHRHMSCYGCRWRCVWETVRCIDEISVEAVWREVEAALAARPVRTGV